MTEFLDDWFETLLTLGTGVSLDSVTNFLVYVSEEALGYLARLKHVFDVALNSNDCSRQFILTKPSYETCREIR